MLFWVLVAAITAGVAAAVVRPLLRNRAAALAGRDAYDRAIYRDQLAELERDEARGVIGGSEAEAARHEVERRLISTTRGATPASVSPATAPRRPWRAGAVAVAVPLAALGLYALLGSPDLPSHPTPSTTMVASAAEGDAAHEEGDASLESAAAGLEKRLAANPSDAEGWLLLARTRAVLRQWRESEKAFQKAVDLTNGAPDALAGYGEMMVMSADGTVSPTARNFFQRALAKDPKHVVARFYLGLAELQDGKAAEAVKSWRALAANSPADASWLAPLRAQIAEAAKQAGITPSPEEVAAASAAAPPEQASPPPQAAAPGPTAADVEAAQSMSPEDRQQMIRGMVRQLADKLKANPDDMAGWQRLARAYDVLGEPDNAAEARSHIKAAPAPQAAAPGPTAAEVEAAQSMSPEDRQQMIRGMVRQLADKLKANPDDMAGWQRLARAYDVLGEPDKAAEARSHIKATPGPQAAAPAPSSPSAPPAAPTPEQVEAAAKMSPEDRRKMIHGMVDRLAEKMEENPDDADGWMRLGRAYAVMGENDKAVAAVDHAAKLRPNDAAPLVVQAQALLGKQPIDGSKPLPPAFLDVAKKLESLSADSPDALWYIGLAAREEKRIGVARASWGQLLSKLNPTSPEAQLVKGAIDKLAK